MDYLTQAMVKGYINRSGLKPLYDERYMTVNKGVINAFVER